MANRTSQAAEEAEEALRKLSRDIHTFRDPAVRLHLQSLSPTSARDSHLSDDPAQLKATIISLQTELNEASEARDRDKGELHDAKKCAAKAKAEVEELESQKREKDIEHEEVLKGAAERLYELEKELAETKKASSEKILLLQKTIEADRLGYAGMVSERNAFQARVKELQANVSAQQREVRAAEDRLRVDARTTDTENRAAREKITALQDEVRFLKNSLRNEDDTSEKLQSSRRQSTDLQREAVFLKTQFAKQTEEAVSVRQRLMEAQETIVNLRGKLGSAAKDRDEISLLKQEVKKWQRQAKDSESNRQRVAALVEEKDVLTSLIRALSPRGDVQEGLKILEASSSAGNIVHPQGDPQDVSFNTLRKDIEIAEERHKLEVQKLEKTVSRLRGESQQAESRLARAIAERDEARSASQRKEKLTRILEHEKSFFKAALERIELEVEAPNTTDMAARRWQERCTTFERTAKEYEAAVKEIEKSLQESQNKIQALTTKVAKTSSPQQERQGMSDELESLKASLSDAIKNADEAVEARRIADRNACEARDRLATVEKELRHLKLGAESTDAMELESVELDYDPSTTKVLHVKNNLLVQAIESAAAEQEKAKGKKRLRAEAGQDGSPLRDGPIDQHLLDLQKQIKELEAENAELLKSSKVGQRTGEIAKKRIEEVRAAIYNVFGWSMRIFGAKFIFSSIYAESKDEVLEFGMNEEGTMQLLETVYTQRIPEEIDQFVHKMNSFPALLASITMENFEKTTLA